MYDHVYPFVFPDSYQFFVYGSYQVYCGYAVRRKIRYGIAFFLGLYRDHAGGRRDPVWNFSYLFRSRTYGQLVVSVAFWRADRHLECNELSHCNQRLQRNHAVIYSCYCDHIYIRLGIADAGNSHVEALLIAVAVGYGVMLLWDVILLYQYFPQGERVPSFS